MKGFFNYLTLVLFISQLMNFLSGIAFSLYAPSMPAIASDFQISITTTKNTITATMLGFALGSIIFGVLMDYYGRRKTLLPAMLLFILVSFSAGFATHIWQVMVIRFFQGVFISAAAIGSRALIVDYFKDKDFVIAILYTTVAYGLGLVLGPFFGGYLQEHYYWQSNFYAYACLGILIELILWLFIRESLVVTETKSVWNVIQFYYSIVKHKTFLAGSTILGIVLIQQLIYPTVGVFLVQDKLGYSPVIFGQSALWIGVSYLGGTLLNRFLLPVFSVKKLIDIGFGMVGFSVFIQLILAFTTGLNLWTLVVPIVILNLGLGFFFGNIMGICLQLFPKNAGMNIAVQTCFLMIASSLGIFLISYFNINTLFAVGITFLIVLLIQAVLFYGIFRLAIRI